MNGQHVPINDEGQVFIYTRFQTLVEVPLSKEERRNLFLPQAGRA